MRWSELVQRVSEVYRELSLSGDAQERLRSFLESRGMKDIKFVGNKIEFVVPYIPLRYVKKDSEIVKIESNSNLGLFNVHVVVANMGSKWVIVDIQPERGNHPNWFPDRAWLCTGHISLSHESLPKLLEHVLTSLEMGTERVNSFNPDSNLDSIARALLGG